MEIDLLEKIKSSGYHKKETFWPGTDLKIHLRILNENDYLQASLATNQVFKEVDLGSKNIDIYNGENETQCLFRAVENPENGRQLFSDITTFRAQLTPEIKEVLSEELNAFHEEFSPNPSRMTQAEFDKLLSTVKKNALMITGSLSNIFILRRLIISLASPRKK